jgi:DNA-binding NtrC family response regulator
VIPPTALPSQLAGASRAEPCRLESARRTFDEQFVRAALVRTGGNRMRAAEELGLSRQGLTKLMARLGIGDAARTSQSPLQAIAYSTADAT